MAAWMERQEWKTQCSRIHAQLDWEGTFMRQAVTLEAACFRPEGLCELTFNVTQPLSPGEDGQTTQPACPAVTCMALYI